MKRVGWIYLVVAALVISAALTSCGGGGSSSGSSNITMTLTNDKIEFDMSGTGEVNVDWGDGKRETFLISGYSNLFRYSYSGSSKYTIKISGENITKFDCNNRQLTSLDVSKNTALKELICHSNQLTSLDVSKNTALTLLSCANNNITSLNVSKNAALTVLYCQANQLTNLNVSKNTALIHLVCYTNQLTSLDVSNNTALTTLHISQNQFTATALNALFETLTGNTEYKKLVINYNPGTNDCNRSIATGLGWNISEY